MKSKYYLYVLSLVVLTLFSCVWADELNEALANQPKPPSWNLKYEASGTANRVNVEYTDLQGQNHELKNIDLPFVCSYDYTSTTDYFLSIQNLDSSGDVIATVYIDSALEKTATNVDAFGFVAIYGTTP